MVIKKLGETHDKWNQFPSYLMRDEHRVYKHIYNMITYDLKKDSTEVIKVRTGTNNDTSHASDRNDRSRHEIPSRNQDSDSDEEELNAAHEDVLIAVKGRKRDLKALEQSERALQKAFKKYNDLAHIGSIDISALIKDNKQYKQ